MIVNRIIFLLAFISTTIYANTLSLDNVDVDTWEVNYTSEVNIAGFQFNLDGGVIIEAYGGIAEENQFLLSSSTTTVLGFSLTGNTIPAGEGTLVIMEIEGNPLGLINIIMADSDGNNLKMTDYLVKPFDIYALSKILDNVIKTSGGETL